MPTHGFWLLPFAAFLAACEPPTTIAGRAAVTDGDSLEIRGTRIRLHAVDAPEGRQTCSRDGEPWRCGDDAAAKLESLVGDAAVSCRRTDVDQYGRWVAVCTRDGVDVGAEMVRAGLALAYRPYGRDYVAEEDAARTAGRGLWAGEFVPPWEWRQNPEPR